MPGGPVKGFDRSLTLGLYWFFFGEVRLPVQRM
jgi:hypothetical protein